MLSAVISNTASLPGDLAASPNDSEPNATSRAIVHVSEKPRVQTK